MKRYLLIFLLGAFAGTVEASEVYVSPQGDDNNPGSKLKPIKTIQQAQLIVRKNIEAGLEDKIRIYLRAGTYRLTKPLVFDCRDTGTGQYDITYTAYEREEVVISGGRIISGWKQESDGRWSTDPGGSVKIREMFVNGKRARRARHPNTGYLQAVKTSEDRMSYFTFNTGDFPSTISAENTELVFIHDWSITRVGLEGIDHNTNRIYPLSKIGRQHPMMVIDGYEPNPRYFLENDPVLCDAPGEWCQDSDGKLIYYPVKGEMIDNIEFIIPVAEKLLLVRGDEKTGCRVKNLHFEELVFEHCSFSFPSKGYAGVQATFHMVDEENGFEKGWRGFVSPAIKFELAENCSFNNGAIRHIGGSGIMFGSRTKNCVLAGSRLTDISGNGIMIGESRDRFVNDQSWWQSAPEQVATDNEIINCIIENCGVQYFGAIGIWVGLAQNTVISHNEVRNLPYTGISVGWMWNPGATPCKGNIIEYNHIHDVMQILSDGGGIYTLGLQPGSILRNNLIHDVPLNAGRAESNGMFLDEGTTDIVIEDNGIYNTVKSPLRFHKAGVNLVQRNILGIIKDIPPVRYNNTPEKNIRLINNKMIKMEAEPGQEIEQIFKNVKTQAGLEKTYILLLKEAVINEN